MFVIKGLLFMRAMESIYLAAMDSIQVVFMGYLPI